MTTAENVGGATSPSLARGAAIGRYVVLGLVGRGAMGEVYAAYDPELDRKVAVKLLRIQVGANNLSASEAKSRLLREAQAIARLSHPNVIVVHDVGSFGDRVFVAMEFVDGTTVGYWLLAAKRSWKEVLRVFMAAGHGLAAAHASQLVHRDFKLENVMIGRDGQVRVMDFGLARRVAGPDHEHQESITPQPIPRARGDRDGSGGGNADGLDLELRESLTATRMITPPGGEVGKGRVPPARQRDIDIDIDIDATNRVPAPGAAPHRSDARPSATRSSVLGSLSTELTETGAIIGTPAYMAPEQFAGDAADERSDQFSFCVALYEGLYGARPFVGASLMELSANVTAGRVLPAPEATRVPGWVRRVVARGLRTDAAERWPSMDALLAALQKDPGSTWRRWVIAAAATAGIAAVGLAARRQGARENRPTCQIAPDRFAQIWEPDAAPGSRRFAISAAFQATGQPYAAAAFGGAARLLDGYVGTWSSMYTDSCQATNVRGEQSAAVLDLRMACLRDRWSELRALSDVLVDPTSEVVANAVKAAAALTSIDRCADVRTLGAAVPPPHDPVVRGQVEKLRGQLATAKALDDAGRSAKALASSAALAALARTVGYQPLLAESLLRLGIVQAQLAKSSEAEANLDEAIWIGQATRLDNLVAAASVEQIFVAGYLQHDLPRARRWLRQAEAYLSRTEGQDLLRSWMLNNFGTALDIHGDLEQAAARYRSALQVKERVLGNSHPDLARSLTNLASALTVLGRPEEALEHSNRGVDIVVKALGWEHPDAAAQLTVRATILNRLGRYTDARLDAARALVIWQRETAPDNPDLTIVLGCLGEAFLGLQQPGEAVAPLEKGLAIAEQHGVYSELRTLRFALARALWESGGDHARAFSLAGQAAEPHRPAATAGSPVPVGDRDVQEKASLWMASREHRRLSRTPSGAVNRFSRQRF